MVDRIWLCFNFCSGHRPSTHYFAIERGETGVKFGIGFELKKLKIKIESGILSEIVSD